MPSERSSERYKIETGEKIHPLVRQLFLNKLRRAGVALTAHQIIDHARKRKLPAPTLSEAFRFLREDVPELAGFAGGRVKPKSGEYQTIGVSKSGVFFIDYGEFYKEWSWHNGGCTGFLLAVENLTNRLFVEPTKGKSTDQWLNSIAKFLEQTRNVKLVYSDRDSVALSRRFRDRLETKYGVKWRFLAKDNKSYLAESLIGFFKRKLAQALRAKGGKRWIDFVKPICDTYNAQTIPKTTYKRGAVDESNFDRFVGQLFGVSDPSLERYNSFKAGPFETDSWNKAVFRFSKGDRVHVVKTAIWKKHLLPDGRKANVFSKRSTGGAFTSKTFTIAGCQLRAVRDYSTLVPVYSLKELGERHLTFYEPQLRRAGKWAEREEENEAAERRQSRSSSVEASPPSRAVLLRRTRPSAETG